MRLFAGWPLPADVDEAIRDAVAPLREELPAASWVRSHLHLTFAFIGEVTQTTAGNLIGVFPSIEAREPLPVEIGPAGFFPGGRRPRVLWLGIRPRDGLTAIAGSVRAVLRASGTPHDEKPFVPHVTLARMREPWSVDHARIAAERLEGLATRVMTVDRVVLFRSRASSRGAVHEVLTERRFS